MDLNQDGRDWRIDQDHGFEPGWKGLEDRPRSWNEQRWKGLENRPRLQ
ncbi:hypothetical protein [Sphingobacterium mizutaii]|nr:hypothetical protein [Sphingobacterium mizutaii]